MSDSTIMCTSDTHIRYMGVSFLSLMLYYPISTFMYPNLQFQNKALDVKYDPSYKIIKVQACLILAGILHSLLYSIRIFKYRHLNLRATWTKINII